MARALLKTPSPNFASGLTSQSQGPPDLTLALAQHQAYQQTLEKMGVQVILLPADELADSCFVEDMAVVAPPLVVATRSGPRGAEQRPVLEALHQALPEHRGVAIQAPAILEGGDVLRLGRHFLVGLTERTNQAGLDQLRACLEPFGYTAAGVDVSGLLHLKTGVSRLDERTVLALPPLAKTLSALGYEVIPVDPEDWHAANALASGRKVLLPSGYPRVVQALAERDFEVLEVNLSEFKKQDGGASCLSIFLE